MAVKVDLCQLIYYFIFNVNLGERNKPNERVTSFVVCVAWPCIWQCYVLRQASFAVAATVVQIQRSCRLPQSVL
jgi:hypothetical protein